jgi:DNA-binding LacI/PurR family transcriptional regulator
MAASRTTLADVARLSGVSKTSASMALADSPRVAADTKDRVRKAARQLGYVPHFAASSLRSQRVDAIAVVVPHDTQHVFSHPIFIDLLEGVLTKANDNDLSPILSTARNASDESSAYSRILRGRMASGVIVAAASTTDENVTAMASAGYPVVVVGRAPKQPGLVTVGVDDIGGAHQAVDHLIKVHGARRIGHVSGPLNHQSAIDKQIGYIRALSDAGLEINPRLQFEGDYTEPSGVDAARALLPEIANCDAIFFANDQMAVAAMEHFAANGVTAPDQLRVVGYDDHPMLRHSRPALTTVSADMVEVGVQSMNKLLQLMAGDTDLDCLELPTQLVVRESCGCNLASA